MPKLKINSISFIRSAKMQDGASFRINEGDEEAMWLNVGFVRNLYTNKGLSTNTSFQMLVGGTISWHELTVTDEMLAAGGGKHVVPNPNGGPDITFEKKGLKQYAHTMLRLSDKLENAIFNSGVTFDSGWADTGRTATTPVTKLATAPTADKPMVTSEMPTAEAENTLDAEVPGDTIPAVQAGATVTPAATTDEIPA